MTAPSPSALSKRLEKAIQQASTPEEVAALVWDLFEQAGTARLARQNAKADRIMEQASTIVEKYVNTAPMRDYWAYRNKLAELERFGAIYKTKVLEITALNDLITHNEIARTVAHWGLRLRWVASDLLGEDNEDLDGSPLKFYFDLFKESLEDADRLLAVLIESRARLLLEDWEGLLGRPAPFDPEYSSAYTAEQAAAGRPIKGSKECPLTPEDLKKPMALPSPWLEEPAAPKAPAKKKAKK